MYYNIIRKLDHVRSMNKANSSPLVTHRMKTWQELRLSLKKSTLFNQVTCE